MSQVSVILSSYNQARWLPTAIRSVLDQTFTDFELIISDNGSTDASKGIAEAFAGDPRVRLVMHPANANVSARLNHAVDLASGEFVSFLYADDYYLPHKLERQIAAFRQLDESYGVVYGWALGEDPVTGRRWPYRALKVRGSAFDALMSGLEHPDMCSPLTRRTCLLMHRFTERVFMEGEGIFLRIALTHLFHFQDEAYVVLRDHGGNRGKAIRMNEEINRVLVEELRRSEHLPPNGGPLIDAYEARLQHTYGWQGARLGVEPQWVRARFRSAARRDHRYLFSPRTWAGMLLVSVPAGLRAQLNSFGHRVRRSPLSPTVVDSYD